MIKYNTPQELFTAICDKIRDKTNSNELINHQDIPDKIDKLANNDTILFIDSAIQGKNTTCYSFNNTTITKIISKIFATTNLTNIDLPECTSIGRDAFYNCTSLITVNFPKCTSIDYSAFYNCANLTTVNFPKCTSIDNNVFNNCTSLTTIIFGADQVVDAPIFVNTPIANGTGYVYVPDNLVDSYKTANRWCTYANQIKPISELSDELKEEYNYL